MRLLIIGDSHVREMDDCIRATHPHIEIMAVIKPRNTIQVIHHFNQHARAEALLFNPDWIALHAGHNDIVHHNKFNPNPQFARNVATQHVRFARNLQIIFPHATMLVSSIYPRTSTYTSNLSLPETGAYNRIAKRYGTRLRELSLPHNIKCSMNNILWRRISKAEEEAGLYSSDGLHLSIDGKTQVGIEWVNVFTQN
jgi:lysophospholipase L1-like esterase